MQETANREVVALHVHSKARAIQAEILGGVTLLIQ